MSSSSLLVALFLSVAGISRGERLLVDVYQTPTGLPTTSMPPTTMLPSAGIAGPPPTTYPSSPPPPPPPAGVAPSGFPSTTFIPTSPPFTSMMPDTTPIPTTPSPTPAVTPPGTTHLLIQYVNSAACKSDIIYCQYVGPTCGSTATSSGFESNAMVVPGPTPTSFKLTACKDNTCSCGYHHTFEIDDCDTRVWDFGSPGDGLRFSRKLIMLMPGDPILQKCRFNQVDVALARFSTEGADLYNFRANTTANATSAPASGTAPSPPPPPPPTAGPPPTAPSSPPPASLISAGMAVVREHQTPPTPSAVLKEQGFSGKKVERYDDLKNVNSDWRKEVPEYQKGGSVRMGSGMLAVMLMCIVGVVLGSNV